MTNPIGAAQRQAGFVSDVDSARIATFLRGVYWWMFGGLAVTAVVALAVASSPAAIGTLVTNKILFFGVIIAELVLVVYLSARVDKMAPATAGILFLAYSALNGVTFALILLVYTGGSVANAFFITAGMFGALAVYGSVTKRDLSAMGRFMFMGLIGLVLASVVGIFWQNDAMQFVMGVVGVLVFSGLIAYDTQRLRAMALQVSGEQAGSYAIVGALSLYLDFINLFLSLLRIFGNRRN
ncbi:MAG: Bax inhibitor-1/YccA family protein [Gemmatimonadales bacterium]|jgi:FtsH-binding integral membrane protein|nr:MAG: Bax inhibitor-1/YccA family protein [Gemmatimonadales bacterium]